MTCKYGKLKSPSKGRRCKSRRSGVRFGGTKKGVGPFNIPVVLLVLFGLYTVMR